MARDSLLSYKALMGHRPISMALVLFSLMVLAASLPSALRADPPFGDGSDGAWHISGPTQLYKDMNFTDLTLTPTGHLDTQGYTVRVSGTLLNQGTITDLTSGGTGGTGGGPASGGSGYSGHQPPASGTVGQPGGSASFAESGDGGNGGGGGGGGGGAWDTDNSEEAEGGSGAPGGSGGNGGGHVVIFAAVLDDQGTIHANGEDGEDGQIGQPGSYTHYTETFPPSDRDMAGGGGGGGAGGNGGDAGTVEIVYGDVINLGNIEANGGLGGNPGIGGVGSNTTESAGSGQHQEVGAPGGGYPAGGAGGRSEIGSTSAFPGTYGMHGQPGGDGTVTVNSAACCGQYTGGMTGNANCGPDGLRTLSDITRLIDRVYISKLDLCCEENGNTNGSVDGLITLSDISRLIDHVYISKGETEPCQ